MAGDTPYHVAIVGGGASGLAILIQLVERGVSGLRVIMFEKNSSIGPGLAYSDACIGTRVNMHASSMSLFPNDTGHFSRWLKKNPSHSNVEAGGDEFPPREHFGAYLKETVTETYQQARQRGIQVVTRQTEVTDMEQSSNGWAIYTADKHTFEATDVTLAPGNHMSQVYKYLNNRPLYFPNPWPNSHLTKEIPQTASIAILGSRLTAIDEALYLTDRGYTGKIYLLSRSGQLPKVQAVQKQRPGRAFSVYNLARELEDNPRGAIITIVRRIHEEMSTDKPKKSRNWATNMPSFDAPEDVATSFRKDVENARDGNIPGQGILRETAPVIERYWRCLDDFSKQTFMKEYMSIWTTYRHAMPLRTGQRLLSLLEKGQLRVLKIDPKNKVQFTNPGFKIPVLSPLENSISVDALIEATGMEYNATRIESSLMRNLLSRHILTPCSAGGVNCDFQTLEANKGLYIIGSMTRGVHFYSTAIDRNVPHAVRIVDHILKVQQRKPLHVALFVGTDIYSTLITSKLIPKLIEAGHMPFLYPTPGSSVPENAPFELKEHDFYEQGLLQETIAPLLGTAVSNTGPSLTLKQLTARHGLLNHPAATDKLSDPDFIRSLSNNHIDLGFSITSSAPLRFPCALISHFRSRKGLFNLQTGALPYYRGVMTALRAMANGEIEFGYSLQGVLSERDSGAGPSEGSVVDIQMQPLNRDTPVLNYLGNTWKIAVEMLCNHTERAARDETITPLEIRPTSPTFSEATGMRLQNASWGLPSRDDLTVYRAQGLTLVDAAAMKQLFVSAFAPQGEEPALRKVIDAACAKWYARERGVELADDRTRVPSVGDGSPVISSRNSSDEENAMVHDVLAKPATTVVVVAAPTLRAAAGGRRAWGLPRRLSDRMQGWMMKRKSTEKVPRVAV